MVGATEVKKVIAIVLLAYACQADVAYHLLGDRSKKTYVGGVATWATFVISTGGVTTNYSNSEGSWQAHTFTNTSVLSVSVAGLIKVLVVGGGGGGSSGGGGAGGVTTQTLFVAVGDYDIVVGTGALGDAVTLTSDLGADNGGDSSAFGLVAYGGGGGANTGNADPGPIENEMWPGYANNGGSGGGGGAFSEAVTLGGAGVSGQGFAGGGNGAYQAVGYPSGGGGGACGFGQDATAAQVAGEGGDGLLCDYTGTATFYGGGGGGCLYMNVVGPTAGGDGGGGDGGIDMINGENGVDYLGGGGGGASGTGVGGKGGDGCVVIAHRVN